MQNKEIEEAKEDLRFFNEGDYITRKMSNNAKVLEQYIDQLENKVKELEKENTDIKEVYIRVAKNLDKKGMLELSEYLLAQIEATPTFTTWEEYTTWISKQLIRDKIENLIKMLNKPNNDRWEKDDNAYYNKIKVQIKVLQELLEEK